MRIHNHHTHTVRHVLRTCLAALAVAVALVAQAAPEHVRQRRDTIRRREVRQEVRDMRSRMATSQQPVEIRQQGRYLCVESKAAQLLPVYTRNGTFYTAFRLTKGTNWLGGLPKGYYIINNRQFAID